MSFALPPPIPSIDAPPTFCYNAGGQPPTPRAASPYAAASFIASRAHLRAEHGAPTAAAPSAAGDGGGGGGARLPAAALRDRLRAELTAAEEEMNLLWNALTLSRDARWGGRGGARTRRVPRAES